MASTYSPLKIELIGTGEQAGTWGTTTNTNLGTALEEAITGRATATFPSDANYTLTYTDSNSSQVFRNLVLNVTSSGNLSATRDLIIPAIEKQYIVENNTSGSQSIRVKTSAGTGVTIPNGRIANVFCDGTNTRFADDYVALNAGTVGLPSLTTTSDTDTGLYFPAANQVALTANGTQVLRVSHNGSTGTTTATGDVSISGSVTSVLKLSDGTVSAPALAAASETNTGIYFPSSEALAVAIGGRKVVEILETIPSVLDSVVVYGGLGTAADEDGTIVAGRINPVVGGASFSTAGGSTYLALQVEELTMMEIKDTGNVGIGTSSPSTRLHVANSGADSYIRAEANSISCQFGVTNNGQVNFTGAPNTGLNMAIGTTNASLLSFATNNTIRINVGSAGGVGIASNASTTDRLVVTGFGATSASSTINFRNSSSTELLRIRDDGVFYTGGAAFSPYNNTTGSAANVHIGAAGDLFRSTSSIRYKKDVTDYDKGLNAVMALRPVYYKDNRTDENKVAGDQTYAGLIAEEVHTAGLGEFVQYNLKNEPDALSYGNMVALLTKAIQELKAELDAVKAELAAMKGN